MFRAQQVTSDSKQVQDDLGHGTEDGALGGDRLCRKLSQLGLEIGFLQLREPKVEHLDAPIVGHHDVGRFEVSMHDALVVRGRDRLGKRNGNVEPFLV